MTEHLSYSKEEVDKLIEKAVNEAVERTLRVMPFVMQNLIASIGKMKEVRDTFYEKHKELSEHKDLVAKVMEEIESKNPAVSLESLADLTAKETKRRLASVSNMSNTAAEKPSRSELQHGLDEILEKL